MKVTVNVTREVPKNVMHIANAVAGGFVGATLTKGTWSAFGLKNPVLKVMTYLTSCLMAANAVATLNGAADDIVDFIADSLPKKEERCEPEMVPEE